MADQVMHAHGQIHNENTFFKPVAADIQRKCQHCEDEEKLHRKENSDADVQGNHELDNYVGSLDSSGQTLPEGSLRFFEPRFGHDFSNVRIHSDTLAAKSAQSINALAYTTGNNIVFNNGQYAPESDDGKKLIAHELTHVVQQTSSSSKNTINRQPQPESQGTPRDQALVERSKRRLELIKPKLDYLRIQKSRITAAKQHAVDDRKNLDIHSIQADWKTRSALEEKNFASLNTGPLEILVLDNEIVFKVKFQALFLDPSNVRFEQLKKTLSDGIKLVWNQILPGDVFGGRKFSIIPDLSLIDSLKSRTTDHWLIEVRKKDDDPVFHPGCKLAEPGPGLPTSVTDPLCDNGVMSIPPLHVTNPGVIGHEMLHLFGLFDRYLELKSKPTDKTKKPEVQQVPTRDSGGRIDPLGGEDGTILSEDLNYIFLKLGVFDKEEIKGLNLLAILETEAIKLEKIIEFGYDPDSLLPVRKDFNDKMIKGAEDLP